MKKMVGLVVLLSAFPLMAQLRITEMCPRPDALGPGGREAGWIELTNTSSTASVDLADYALIRWNRGKTDSAKNRKALPSRMVEPLERVLVYTSEEWPNIDGEEVAEYTVEGYDAPVIIFPFKVNPKKWPNVRLYKGDTIVDTFAVPVDLEDNKSFAPGEDMVVSPLVDAETAYVYRKVGDAEWTAGGKGLMAGVPSEEPTDVAGRMEATPAADVAAFDVGTLADTNGTLRGAAYDLSDNADEHAGVTLPATVAAELAKGPYTVSLWFKADRAEASRPLFDSRPSTTGSASGTILFLTASGQLTAQPRNANKGNQEASSDTEADYADGAWHHVVLVSGQTIGDPFVLWVDGEICFNSTLTVAAALHPDQPLCFGRALDSTYWDSFDGGLADIRVYPRALTEAEAKAVMHEGAVVEVTGTLTKSGDTVTEAEGFYTFAGAANASSAYVEATIATSQATPGETVDLWVNPSAYPAQGEHSTALIDAREISAAGYMFLLGTDGGLRLQRGVGGQPSFEETNLEVSIPANAWSHLTLALDKAAKEATIYLNGRKAKTFALAKAYSAPTASHRFGGTRDNWWSVYRGSLASPKVYNGVLDALEIAKLHNASPLATTKVLVDGVSIDAQTVVPTGETVTAIEAQTTITFPEPREGGVDFVRLTVADVKGTVSVSLGGEALEPGKILPAPAAGEQVLAWTVTPSDGEVSASVQLDYLRMVGEGITTRQILPHMTPGAENDTTDAVPYGPNIGPALSGGSGNGVTAPNPAPVATAYPVTYEIHPLGTEEATKIESVTLLYRADFGEIKEAPMKSVDGVKWSATIPAADIPAPGHLLRYAARITDGSRNTWRSPSFKNPDDGYEWYGTIVAPTADQETATLQTFHLFADDKAKTLMDKQYDHVKVATPYGARVAVYDGQTGAFYDNVRIDLRGNTSAGFNKKSHGLRFNKCQPLECENPYTGEELETRKTSFIAEYCDPTYVRQSLSFWIWREAGNLVPFDYPVRLQLNGDFYQLAFHSNRFTDELIEDYYGLDPLGYAYKNVGTFAPKGHTTAGGIEKKTPDDDNESDLSVLFDFCEKLSQASAGSESENEALTQEVVRDFDLPAWINYLAAARITQESDDVWANICAYGDLRGTGTWMPLAYDHNLSFGQYYRGYNGSKDGLRANVDTYKSHPFYSGFRLKNGFTDANYAIEAVLQSPKFRRLYLRRLRTLMDDILMKPGTSQTKTPFWEYATQLRDDFEEIVERDRTLWKYDTGAINTQIWVWPTTMSLEDGFTDLWENYVVPRREHLFNTHSVMNTTRTIGYSTDTIAGIPLEQAATEDLAAGFSFANAQNTDGSTVGFAEEADCLIIHNSNPDAVDMSGWVLSGAVAWTLPSGTVIDAGDDLIVVFDRKAYIEAHASELTNQVIIGNAERGASPFIRLDDDEGNAVVSVRWAAPTPEQQFLRVAEVLANTATDGGDGAEYLVLTNLSDSVTLNLKGCRLCARKSADGEPWKVDISLPKGLTLAPGATVRLNKADYAKDGWDKLTNNKVIMKLYDGSADLAQSLYFASSWWPSTDGGGASLVAVDFGNSVTEKAQWKPSFEVADEATAAVTSAAIAARPEIAAWLSTLDTAGQTALATFDGSVDDLDLCWLADLPPQAAPAVELELSIDYDADGNLVLGGALLVNDVEKTGHVNGSLTLLRYTELGTPPEEAPLTSKNFPLDLKEAPGTAGFFRIRLK